MTYMIHVFFFEQLGAFSSQVFQESPRDKLWKKKHCNFSHFTISFHIAFVMFVIYLCSLTAAPIYEMEKHFNIEIAGQISRVSSAHNGI